MSASNGPDLAETNSNAKTTTGDALSGRSGRVWVALVTARPALDAIDNLGPRRTLTEDWAGLPDGSETAESDDPEGEAPRGSTYSVLYRVARIRPR